MYNNQIILLTDDFQPQLKKSKPIQWTLQWNVHERFFWCICYERKSNEEEKKSHRILWLRLSSHYKIVQCKLNMKWSTQRHTNTRTRTRIKCGQSYRTFEWSKAISQAKCCAFKNQKSISTLHTFCFSAVSFSFDSVQVLYLCCQLFGYRCRSLQIRCNTHTHKQFAELIFNTFNPQKNNHTNALIVFMFNFHWRFCM